MRRKSRGIIPSFSRCRHTAVLVDERPAAELFEACGDVVGERELRARGGRSCAVHSSWQHPPRQHPPPLLLMPVAAGNPRQHSAVIRAVRSPRGPLALSGPPVRFALPGADGRAAVCLSVYQRVPAGSLRGCLTSIRGA